METLTTTAPSSYESPEFSNKRIQKAGKSLKKSIDTKDDRDVLNNWRSSHAYPLDVIAKVLSNTALDLDSNALIAKRLKRTPSIINKLKLQPTMSLANMQDIGGCRAIVKDVEAVYNTAQNLNEALIDHKHIYTADYLANPKDTGYRGIHVIYKFDSCKQSIKHDGLFVEVQIRTRMQHCWATAVETMGAYLEQGLKSSQGDKRYLEYFQIIGDLFAIHESLPLFNKEMDLEALLNKCTALGELLQVNQKLTLFSHATQMIQNDLTGDDATYDYYLIITDAKSGTIKVRPVTTEELKMANTAYTTLEYRFRHQYGKDVVLVSSTTLSELRTTYPNYFSDTKEFLENIYRIRSTFLHETTHLEHAESYRSFTMIREVQEVKLRSRRLLKKRKSRARGMIRNVRMLSKRIRHLKDPKDVEVYEQRIERLKKQTIDFCKKTAQVELFISQIPKK